MPERRRAAPIGLAALAIAIAAGWAAFAAKGNHVQEIKFDLGRDIVATAKESGVPKFSVDDVDGLVTYGVSRVPPDVVAHFAHPGLDITWQPVFDFSMNADEKLSAGRQADTAELQLDARF